MQQQQMEMPPVGGAYPVPPMGGYPPQGYDQYGQGQAAPAPAPYGQVPPPPYGQVPPPPPPQDQQDGIVYGYPVHDNAGASNAVAGTPAQYAQQQGK